MASLSSLLRGSSIRADAADLDTPTAARLGRAFGTLIRRRASALGWKGPRARVVVARADDTATLAVRDGLVRGLVLAGHDVKDVGAVASDVFTFAMRHLAAPAGIVVTPGGEGALSVIFFLGGRPLVGEGLTALAQIGDGEDFAAGEGSLEIVDVMAVFNGAPRDVDTEGAA